MSSRARVPAWLWAQGLSVKLGLGTECPLFPGQEVGPQPVERGSIRWLGVCRKLPLFPPSPERLSAYLEENQAWKRISLSVFQRLGATKGFTSSGASMSAGSTDRAGEGNSAPSWEGVTGAAPVPGEALVPGGTFPGGFAVPSRGCGDGAELCGAGQSHVSHHIPGQSCWNPRQCHWSRSVHVSSRHRRVVFGAEPSFGGGHTRQPRRVLCQKRHRSREPRARGRIC